MSTYLGIDIGAETAKLVVIEKAGDRLSIAEHALAPHNKDPHHTLRTLFGKLAHHDPRGIAVTGRLQRVMHAQGVPTKAAMRRGLRMVHPELQAATLISIGAHGFSVLELGARGEEWFQQNSRCSQGTGNFLTQLVQRFGMSVEEASELCEPVKNPAPLSGRCPVILKTDMTHLANKGESKERILAGLYDAVCENVLNLVRPRFAPRDVVLIGGVARSERVRRTIATWLEAKGLRLVPHRSEHEFLEAVGAATHAMEHPCDVPSIENLLATAVGTKLEEVPSLRDALNKVHRITKPKIDVAWVNPRDVYFGFDIGSTGSKAVALEVSTGEIVWETYLNTEGAPVRAAQALVERWVEHVGDRGRVRAVGVTGSGREVVGSLLRTCYGDQRVFVMNEIAAHARGASSIDPQVDTIFEIGGQDAKYIRLEGGRVIDAAMNEACSAGTGSFIAEQGSKFEGVGNDVVKLGRMAIDADRGISLGQHCSVFMAEVIDEAITQGVETDVIIAGLYDSVIQNYLNRVKGPRSVGQRVFCQGMPFSSDALAAAVARQTGREVVIPPNPGTIGALGIALLAMDELKTQAQGDTFVVDPQLFLGAKVASKETFVCPSTKGCGGSGNKCRIDRLTTVVSGQTQKFIWGGNCSLYDRGAGRKKLPDLAPDPFRQRDELVDALVAETKREGGAPVVGFTDEFALRGVAPFFLVFLHRLGMDTRMIRHAGGKTLRRGIEGARIPYCAPMQMYHGVFFDLIDTKPDYVLLPMVEELPAASTEQYSTLCPIVQASPDLVGSLLENDLSRSRILRPIMRFDGAGYDGKPFQAEMRKMAEQLGQGHRFEVAIREAIAAQRKFEDDCMLIGAKALEFCKDKAVVPVVVLGRPYTIHNDVLNSNVPSILRSLGAMPIPMDCLPVPDDTPVYDHQYWAYTQRNLRAADYVRRTPGLYSVFASNYACGPDSFTLHFYAYIMQGKPFAVVETDGHSGDAGTKTRMEAFLYCVDADVKSKASHGAEYHDLNDTNGMSWSAREVKERNALLLVPRMGMGAEVAAAALRAEGFRCEALPLPTRDDVRVGRRYTSGKECVPMMLTLGVMLNRIEKGRESGETFALTMPTARGPCRFGVYNVLHKIVLEQTGWKGQVGVFSPDDGDYFREVSPEFSARIWAGFMAHDLIEAMLFDVRPVERVPGAANRLYDKYKKEVLDCMEVRPKGSALAMMKEIFGGLWGTRDIVRRAAKEMSAIKNRMKEVPAVAVVGEIYVRLDPFANDFIVEKLEQRGLKAKFAPFIEWLEYTSYLAEERVIDGRMRADDNPISIGLTGVVQRATLDGLYNEVAKELGWGPRTTVRQSLEKAQPYIDNALTGEAVLTLGGPLHEFHENEIHGVVVVGPHECMPCKIAEAQFGKVAEEANLPYLVFELNGDPIDTEALDRFAYDIHEVHRRGVGRDLNAVLGGFGGTDARVSERGNDTKLVPLRVPSKDKRRKPDTSALD